MLTDPIRWAAPRPPALFVPVRQGMLHPAALFVPARQGMPHPPFRTKMALKAVCNTVCAPSSGLSGAQHHSSTPPYTSRISGMRRRDLRPCRSLDIDRRRCPFVRPVFLG
eukprot:7310892-Prymnesium_polylepis.1